MSAIWNDVEEANSIAPSGEKPKAILDLTLIIQCFTRQRVRRTVRVIYDSQIEYPPVALNIVTVDTYQ